MDAEKTWTLTGRSTKDAVHNIVTKVGICPPRQTPEFLIDIPGYYDYIVRKYAT